MKLNKNIKYSDTFLGIVPNSELRAGRLIDCIKAAIRGTAFTLRRSGRNSVLRQFYGMYPGRQTYSIKLRCPVQTHRGRLQQDLPLKHATHFALYLKPRDPRNYRAIPGVKQRVADTLVGTRCGNGLVVRSVKVEKLHEVITALGD